ncbi:MAG: extracellular solute-binding protein [Alphaproteobacteria bacterium]|nr:extracellular solute-binding protein [Alphaproteobacteria bacterium]
MSRRRLLHGAALASSALVARRLGAPFVSGAYAAGKLSCGFWDHWVPTANEPMRQMCREWGEKNKVDVEVDFITSNGDKILMTIAGEAQARAGHDVLSIPTWYAAGQADNLEPVDDVMKQLIAANGKVSQAAEYLGKQEGRWVGVPGTWGNATFPCVARIDQMKELAGIDIVKMYPASGLPDKALADQWTWEAFLEAAQKCFKAGYPFGEPMSAASDAINWAGGLFAAYGSELVDKDGNIAVKSDATREVLEWFKQFLAVSPPDVWAWDNAGNNKWLLSGKGPLIQNPPSAWAVAKRDAPEIAAQCWCFPPPKGPKGRFVAGQTYFWGVWNFSPNKSAGKELIQYLADRPQAERLVAVTEGYDIPSFEGQLDFKTWAEQGPPPGTLSNYPPRGDVIVSISGAPAPTRIGTQMFAQGTMTKMVAHCTTQGQSIEAAMDWAAGELEGFMRT